jgi:hypothetical protein
MGSMVIFTEYSHAINLLINQHLPQVINLSDHEVELLVAKTCFVYVAEKPSIFKKSDLNVTTLSDPEGNQISCKWFSVYWRPKIVNNVLTFLPKVEFNSFNGPRDVAGELRSAMQSHLSELNTKERSFSARPPIPLPEQTVFVPVEYHLYPVMGPTTMLQSEFNEKYRKMFEFIRNNIDL